MPHYGLPGHTRTYTLAGTLFTLAIAWFVVSPFAVVPLVGFTGWLLEMTGTTESLWPVSWLVALAAVIGVTHFLFRVRRQLTTRVTWWCDRCGTETDPRFEICRTCGRVKRNTAPTT